MSNQLSEILDSDHSLEKFEEIEMSRQETLQFIREGHDELLMHQQSILGSEHEIKVMKELNDA